ncbi:MAG: helix-turn-helix domain-containing protein, partial [Lachnospiraceae bacterium]|nr:helix-turn-helix domain-containing protein [Lachnospiraceae bacterium]
TNTDLLNTESNKRKREKEPRHQYGEYRNVLLSDSEMQTLQAEFPQDYRQRIERLSEYMASTGKSYKSHLATIRSWARRDRGKPTAKSYSHDNYRCEEGESL